MDTLDTFVEAPLRDVRRDLHAHPEAGWKEFRTTALLADALEDLGYDVLLGSETVDPDERLGVPPADDVAAARARARNEGAPEEYLDEMGDITGVIATKTFGDGPVIGVRTDIDALPMQEAMDDDHRPAREGFASAHPGEMHACGHDAHAAIGLGVAREFAGNGFDGTLKLFFQSAEEGGRGGKPMAESGHLDDVDHLLAVHVGLDEPTGTVLSSYDAPLANAKLDVTFDGEPAHAGREPNAGRNALQAATAAIGNLYGIARHGDERTRINVGRVSADNAQNVICEEATMRVEVRGGTHDANEYMLERAREVIDGAATMHDVDYETSLYGKTTTFENDDALTERVEAAARATEAVDEIIRKEFGGSEDASYLIRRVQKQGGTATYLGIGASNSAGHHTAYFDIDETAIDIGVDVLVDTVELLT
ncbi:aminobenzoyl-glutamate utilization protein A [Halobiforma haloterrestris]|uniref:Aminobenzoyl-glutamate utilization protein A n=1 Tax=Natronobacterium haloterrestre TaxID=148448 RepID=A0A1I1HSJ5_NATHA|nr:amidohydrolase [Halobiforma haloterrestris]SFC26866.1 aminobenzoyl-glutamate utilization protein A [Halobiforma haloterrestris]